MVRNNGHELKRGILEGVQCNESMLEWPHVDPSEYDKSIWKWALKKVLMRNEYSIKYRLGKWDPHEHHLIATYMVNRNKELCMYRNGRWS